MRGSSSGSLCRPALPFSLHWGNHECCLAEGLNLWTPRFWLPSTSDDGLSYSFDVGANHFVSLFATGDYRLTITQMTASWLEADLAQARSRGAKRLIVYQHEPIFCTGANHPGTPGRACGPRPDTRAPQGRSPLERTRSEL
jgi:hypothetical protein